ncbi:MAG: hypothetical protein ACR2RF_16755 [Geminicoccaceae bacterium]
MLTESKLRAHARLVAKDIKAGKATTHSDLARDLMEENPDAVLGVIGLIQQTASRKKPNQALIHAYGYMFTVGLEMLRYQIERGQEWAEDLLDDIRDVLCLLAEDGIVDPGLLMLLLNGFIEAQLDPGEDLTQLIGEITLEEAKYEQPTDMPSDIGVLFEGLVQEVGDNPFQIYDVFAEASRALPLEFRQGMLPQIATAENPILRDVATLYLLDPSSEVRQSFCQAMAANASPDVISPTALRRMIAVRNWLPEKERHHLDAAIKKARQMHVDCGSWPKRRVLDIQASNIDGVGAQSVFAVIKDGPKHIIASLLVKKAVGIADAWCLRDQSKAEVLDFFTQIQAQTESVAVDLGFVRALIMHHLAVGVDAGKAPSVGLLEFVEATGIETCHPEALSVDDLITKMAKDIGPEVLDPKAVDELVRGSTDWLNRYDFMDSWFENDALVEEVLDQSPRSRMPGKIKAITTSVLEPRRTKWAERFLWTALWMKQQGDSPWQDFFVMGRELHRSRPLAQIPIMQDIAKVTVEAAGNPWF